MDGARRDGKCENGAKKGVMSFGRRKARESRAAVFCSAVA